MKKIIISLLLTAALVTTAACGAEGSAFSSDAGKKINVVCTIFPQYDWVREIAGENIKNIDLTLLLNSGIDLHSYNPTVQDIARIKSADLFIYVGGHSDGWVKDALAGANPDMITLNLVEVIGDAVIMTESSHNCGCGPGCHCHKTPEECDCAETGEIYDECDEEHEENGAEADEHIWMSLKRAELVCRAIAEALITLDPENAELYENNKNAYAAKLSALDDEYRAVVDSAEKNTLVIADRFPFLYLTEDYGLEHYAAFHGCSAETEASFVTVISLAVKINQLGLNTVIVTESSNQEIAKTVISETNDKNQQILVLNAIQSIVTEDVNNGVTYLSIMESNLEVLRKALN